MNLKSTLILCIISIVTLGSACNNSQKALYRGDYDKAISQSVKKLRKNKQKDKHIIILEDAYNKANARDLGQIEYLKTEGSPNNWMDIFGLYSTIDARQNLVRPLLPLRMQSPSRKANLPMNNYNEEMVSAKQRAAEFLYANANKALNSKNKEQARAAYEDLKTVKKMFPTFKDVDSKINQARAVGMNNVLVKLKNHTGMPLPPEFEKEIIRLNTSNLNRKWVNYDTNPNSNVAYDYDIIINLQQVEISPESLRERVYNRIRHQKDGWIYSKNDDGSYKVDSEGNKLKVQKVVQLSCEVIEVEQHKVATIGGSVDYFNRNTRQMLGSYPIASDAVFVNHYAVVHGNPDALDTDKKEDKLLISLSHNRPAPFPDDFALMMQASNTLKEAVDDVIRDHKRLVSR